MRGATNMLNIKAQLLIAAILMSATGAMAAETADQAGVRAPSAATDVEVPRADAVKKPDAKKQQTAAETVDQTGGAAARKPSVETADQTNPPAVAAAAEVTAPPKSDVKRLEARKPQPHTASNCEWYSWSCWSGRVGLVLGTAY